MLCFTAVGTKSVCSLLRRLLTWRCPHLLLRLSADACCMALAARPQLSIDVLPAGRPAENLPHTAAAVDRWDRQTDRRATVTQTLLRILCGQHQQLTLKFCCALHRYGADTLSFLPANKSFGLNARISWTGASQLDSLCCDLSFCTNSLRRCCCCKPTAHCNKLCELSGALPPPRALPRPLS